MKITFCVFFTILLLLLSGCKENGKRGKEINVIYMAQAGYQPEEIQKMTAEFEKIKDTKVNLTFVKYDEQHSQIVKSATSKDAIYDVFSLDLIWTAEFAEKGYCCDLSDKVESVSLDIPPAIVDAFDYRNSIWAMPFLANFQLFFYNTDYIKRAGFKDPPKTLEEMVEQMKVIKRYNIVKYPWSDSWNKKEGLICEYVWLTAAFGGDTFDIRSKPIFNEGPGLEALEFMVMLLKEGLANPISLTSDETMVKDTFISGQSAFTSNWTFQYAQMNNPEVSSVVG
ncbi:MAG TPA: extracellular solute-binding protein, partial [Spirochaetota bacterium]|nr:extracellular solute-binding protein [Spirochaetota bacterium]